MKKQIILLLTLMFISSCSFDNKNSINEINPYEKKFDFIYDENQDKTFTSSKDNPKLKKEDIKNKCTIIENRNYYGFYEKNIELSNKLPAPNNLISSREELSTVMDYCAFYHVEYYEVSVDPNYFCDYFYTEVNNAFWEAKLLSGTVGMDFEYSKNENNLKFHFFYNSEAGKYKCNSTHKENAIIPYNYYSNQEKRPVNFDDFGYKNNDAGVVDVYNSDQLIYVLENGYLPKVISDSPAEVILNKSKEILNNIIYDDMTENQKLMAIYCYIYNHSFYDNDADSFASYTYDDEHMPDEIASCFDSLYAEGVLLDGRGICHAYGKAFNLLATIEGIDSTKIVSAYDSIDTSKTISPIVREKSGGKVISAVYLSHGYSYVLSSEDNKYYICDPTYSIAITLRDEDEFDFTLYRSLSVMESHRDWINVYGALNNDWFYQKNKDKMGENSYIWQNDFIMKINDNEFDYYLNSIEEEICLENNLIEYLMNYNNENFINSTSIFQFQFWINPDSEINSLIFDKLNSFISSIINCEEYELMFYYHYDGDIFCNNLFDIGYIITFKKL